MRDIKFRAWLHDEMFITPLDTNFAISRFFGFIGDSDIVMQFTGLQDKNGKDIYDGDIILYGETNYHVRWNFSRWIMFDKEFDGHDGFGMPLVGPSFSKNKMKDIEIIGNIYENPELLKGG